MKKRNVAIVAVAIVVLAALFIPRILDKGEDYDAIILPTVEISNPVIGDIANDTGLIGKIEPTDVVYITPELSGEVTDVYVKAGDKVSAGQTLCNIENKQLSNLGISVDSAMVSLNDAQAAYDRVKVLYENGAASKENFESATSALQRAKLQYESAQISYGITADSGVVSSPISGKVEKCDVEQHQTVSPAVQLFVISSEDSEKVIKFSVTERIVNGLTEGDAIKIEKNGTTYKGNITEISSMVDSSSGLFEIKASIENGENLSTGTTAKVYVTAEKATGVMIIPVDSVYYENGKAFVYTYEDGHANKVFVETGMSDTKNIEVLSGLTKKDKVITTWSSELYDKAEVLLPKEESK